MSDSESDIEHDPPLKRPPPLISNDGYIKPHPPSVLNQQHHPAYIMMPQGSYSHGVQVIQGADGTLYAITSPTTSQHQLAKSATILDINSLANSHPRAGLTSSLLTANQGVGATQTGQHSVPLVPIYAPISVSPAAAAAPKQHVIQNPKSESREESIRSIPIQQHASVGIKQLAMSPLHNSQHTGITLVSTNGPKSPTIAYVVQEDQQHSPSPSSEYNTHSPSHKEESSHVFKYTHNALTVTSPTSGQFRSHKPLTEGLNSVQRATILQKHRRSLAGVQESEILQEYTTDEGYSENHSMVGTARGTVLSGDGKKSAESSSLMKLLQSEPKRSVSSTSESEDDNTFSLLGNEPYLVKFYQFFQSSNQSEHLRMRVLSTEGSSNIVKWIEVTRKSSHIDPNFGPLDAVRILISSNGLCKMQLIFPYCKTLFTRFMPSSQLQANELFNELSPAHVLCPGIPDCETKIASLGYHPASVRVIETPTMRRFDHEKCPMWHIPLPCNLYSESGQIMHHMCRQCKNLHNTLNRTVDKICRFNATTGGAIVAEHYPLVQPAQIYAISTSASGHGLNKGSIHKSKKDKKRYPTHSRKSSSSDIEHEQGLPNSHSEEHTISITKETHSPTPKHQVPRTHAQADDKDTATAEVFPKVTLVPNDMAFTKTTATKVVFTSSTSSREPNEHTAVAWSSDVAQMDKNFVGNKDQEYKIQKLGGLNSVRKRISSQDATTAGQKKRKVSVSFADEQDFESDSQSLDEKQPTDD